MKNTFFLLIFICFNCYSQNLSKQEQKELSEVLSKAKNTVKPVKTYLNNTLSDEYLAKIKSNLGNRKTFLKEFEKQTLTALSYYPELKDCQIEFIRSNIKTTMACRPTTSSLTRRYNREYIITIDNNDEGQGITLDNVPYNAQVGVIGHELAHIIDYENRSSTNIASIGLDYATGHYPTEFEKRVDKITINKGLGWQLYDWADFVLNKSKASSEYKEFKRQTYLIPEQIKQEIIKDRQYNFAYSKGFWKNDFMIEIWGVCFGLCLSFICQADFRKLVLKYLRND